MLRDTTISSKARRARRVLEAHDARRARQSRVHILLRPRDQPVERFPADFDGVVHEEYLHRYLESLGVQPTRASLAVLRRELPRHRVKITAAWRSRGWKSDTLQVAPVKQKYVAAGAVATPREVLARVAAQELREAVGGDDVVRVDEDGGGRRWEERRVERERRHKVAVKRRAALAPVALHVVRDEDEPLYEYSYRRFFELTTVTSKTMRARKKSSWRQRHGRQLHGAKVILPPVPGAAQGEGQTSAPQLRRSAEAHRRKGSGRRKQKKTRRQQRQQRQPREVTFLGHPAAVIAKHFPSEFQDVHDAQPRFDAQAVVRFVDGFVECFPTHMFSREFSEQHMSRLVDVLADKNATALVQLVCDLVFYDLFAPFLPAGAEHVRAAWAELDEQLYVIHSQHAELDERLRELRNYPRVHALFVDAMSSTVQNMLRDVFQVWFRSALGAPTCEEIDATVSQLFDRATQLAGARDLRNATSFLVKAAMKKKHLRAANPLEAQANLEAEAQQFKLQGDEHRSELLQKAVAQLQRRKRRQEAVLERARWRAKVRRERKLQAERIRQRQAQRQSDHHDVLTRLERETYKDMLDSSDSDYDVQRAW